MQNTLMLDVKVTVLGDSNRTLVTGSRLHFYHGARETLCKLVLLGRDALAPGEEGFAQLAALFTMVGQIEKEHEERYRALADNLKNSRVFAREEQQVWQCRNCGYTYIGKSAPLKCPVCAHPQSYFELKKINY